MSEEITELTSILANILLEKKQKNSSYSLRALARDLKIAPGHLHRILHNQVTPSPMVAYRVGRLLNFNNDQIVHLIETIIE